jgi:hypothetical protein
MEFIKCLEELGLEDGATTKKGLRIGCRENKKYGINIWENFSTRRVPKSELEKIAP